VAAQIYKASKLTFCAIEIEQKLKLICQTIHFAYKMQ